MVKGESGVLGKVRVEGREKCLGMWICKVVEVLDREDCGCFGKEDRVVWVIGVVG